MAALISETKRISNKFGIVIQSSIFTHEILTAVKMSVLVM